QNDSPAPALQNLPEKNSGGAVVIDVGSIEKIHAQVQAAAYNTKGRCLVHLRSERHRAETGSRNVKIGVLKSANLHSPEGLSSQKFQATRDLTVTRLTGVM